ILCISASSLPLSSPGQAQTKPPSQADPVSGRYEGTGHSRDLGDMVLTLELTNDHGTVSGSLTASTANFPVNGSFQGGQLTLKFKLAEQDGTLTAQLKDRVITGTWSLGDDDGPINLTRKTTVEVGSALPSRSPAPADLRTVAFVDVNVIPMDRERVVRAQTVVVKQGRIAEIGPAARVRVPKDALRVDGRGRFLMPGLIDMHVHVFSDDKEMRLFVANGITTVRNMAGQPNHLKLRERIAAGQVFGPTLYTCGPLLLGYKNAAAAKHEVEQQCAAGYDCIKIYNITDWSKEAYDAAIDTAVSKGVPAVGHLPRNLPIETTLRPGRQTVEHVEELLYPYFFKLTNKFDESKIPYVAKLMKENGISIDPTLTVYHYIRLIVADDSFHQLVNRPELKYISPRVRKQWISNNSYRKRFTEKNLPFLDRSMAFLRILAKGLHDAGIRTLLGTDTSEDQPFVLPGFSIHEELRELVDAGLTPYEALQAGTANAAETLNASGDIGTVAVGKRADLLLLDLNPFENVANANRRAGVMLRGRWLPETELKKMLDDLAAEYAAEN
ncbi:MAG: amidohydrolase family protein, partial [Blastocatellia bacterium]